jgi:hypothetical protein
VSAPAAAAGAAVAVTWSPRPSTSACCRRAMVPLMLPAPAQHAAARAAKRATQGGAGMQTLPAAPAGVRCVPGTDADSASPGLAQRPTHRRTHTRAPCSPAAPPGAHHPQGAAPRQAAALG